MYFVSHKIRAPRNSQQPQEGPACRFRGGHFLRLFFSFFFFWAIKFLNPPPRQPGTHTLTHTFRKPSPITFQRLFHHHHLHVLLASISRTRTKFRQRSAAIRILARFGHGAAGSCLARFGLAEMIGLTDFVFFEGMKAGADKGARETSRSNLSPVQLNPSLTRFQHLGVLAYLIPHRTNLQCPIHPTSNAVWRAGYGIRHHRQMNTFASRK